MLQDITTRWLSQLKPAERIWKQYAALVFAFDEFSATRSNDQAQATSIFNELVELERMLGLGAVLPMLRIMNTLVKTCQERHIFVQDLSEVRASCCMRDAGCCMQDAGFCMRDDA